MLKRILMPVLSILLLNLAVAPSAFASGNAEKDAKKAEKVKANIAKLGTGQDAKVKLKLKDGTKIEGYIKESTAEQFVVMDSMSGQAVPVLYHNVKQVKGNNLTTGVKILIGVGILIAFLIFVNHELGKS